METPYNRRFFDKDKGGPIDHLRPGRTREAQKKEFSPPGLTLVAFVREGDRWPIQFACQRLKGARVTFHGLDIRAHLTIQGILGRRSPRLSAEQRRDVIDAAKFAADQVFGTTSSLRVELNSIEVGRSDGEIAGTVVWLAPKACNSELMRLSGEFRGSLARMLTEIEPSLALPPEQPGGKWLTLGFFDEDADFAVDRDLAEAFDELQYSAAEIRIDEVSLVEFHHKNLVNSHVLSITPFRQARPQAVVIKAKPKVLARSLWPSFRGWSFLFDNPGGRLRGDGAQVIACRPWNEPALELYRALGEGLEALNLHTTRNPYTFHRVESGSFHVTVLDGHNEENMGHLARKTQELAAGILRQLPFRFGPLPRELFDENAFQGVISRERMLRLKFSHLRLWKNRVLVARLQPIDQESANALLAVENRRRELDQRFVIQGRAAVGEFKPHCTLGYFVDETAAANAQHLIDEWNTKFREFTAGRTIEFTSISAYGFSDMATFVKVEGSERPAHPRGSAG